MHVEEENEITLEIIVPQSEVEPDNTISSTVNDHVDEEFEIPIEAVSQSQTPIAPTVPYGWSSDILVAPSCSPPPPPLPPRSSSRQPSISRSTSPSCMVNRSTAGATLVPFPDFNVNSDVCQLKYALEDRNKDKLIEILCHRSTDQRVQIAELFHSLYGISLSQHIKESFGHSHFVTLMTGLSTLMHEFFADAIYTLNSNIWICYLMFILPNCVRLAMREYFEMRNYIKFNVLNNFITLSI